MQKELRENSIFPDLAADAGPFPAFTRGAALLMIKDEADIILMNLLWLYHIGLRRFLIVDNLSTDGTDHELVKFQTCRPAAEVVIKQDAVVAYYQAKKVTSMGQLAKQIWPDVDWLLPIDADEFLIARHGMLALAYVPDEVQALTVPKTVHFLRSKNRPGSGNLLEHMPVRSGLFVVPPKVILRALPYLGVTQGNHKVRTADHSRVFYTGGFQYGFYYREFQTRSFMQFVSKVRNGGRAILAAQAEGHKVGGEHWIAWYQVYVADGEAGLQKIFESECFRKPGRNYVVDPFAGLPHGLA